MRILLLTKRRYINRDLIDDRYGRLHELPIRWARESTVRVACLDYAGRPDQVQNYEGVTSVSRSVRRRPISSILETLGEAAFAPDVVVASSDIFYGLVGLRIARAARAKFVFDLYDDYRLFGINRWSGLALAFGAVCRRADLLICASETVNRAVASFGPPRLLIPNGYDPKLFRPGRDLAPRARLGIGDDELLMIYPGAAVTRVDVELVARGLEQLNASGLPARALFVGDRSQEAAARSRYIVGHPPIAHSEVADLIRCSDIGIAPYASTGLTETAAPCKVAEFLACGLPVVASDVSDLKTFSRFGVVTFPVGDAAAFVAAVRKQAGAGPSTPVPGWTWPELAAKSLEAIKALPGAERV